MVFGDDSDVDEAWEKVLAIWHYWLRRHRWPSLQERIENGDCDE